MCFCADIISEKHSTERIFTRNQWLNYLNTQADDWFCNYIVGTATAGIGHSGEKRSWGVSWSSPSGELDPVAREDASQARHAKMFSEGALRISARGPNIWHLPFPLKLWQHSKEAGDFSPNRLFHISFAKVALQSCGCKSVGTCCGNNGDKGSCQFQEGALSGWVIIWDSKWARVGGQGGLWLNYFFCNPNLEEWKNMDGYCINKWN